MGEVPGTWYCASTGAVEYSRDFDKNGPTLALFAPLASQLLIGNKVFPRKPRRIFGLRWLSGLKTALAKSRKIEVL